jgi:hypothetical protein
VGRERRPVGRNRDGRVSGAVHAERVGGVPVLRVVVPRGLCRRRARRLGVCDIQCREPVGDRGLERPAITARTNSASHLRARLFRAGVGVSCADLGASARTKAAWARSSAACALASGAGALDRFAVVCDEGQALSGASGAGGPR